MFVPLRTDDPAGTPFVRTRPRIQKRQLRVILPRGRRGAALERHEELTYRGYVGDEYRRQCGWIVGQMARLFLREP
jgi:hypothetical protein